MIEGVVTSDREAVLKLAVRGPDSTQRRIDATIDTGFDGWLSLPSGAIRALGLQWRERGRALLADGRNTVFDIYEGELFWDGKWRRIVVDEADTTPLVGTSLLENCELKIEFHEGGIVTIRPIGGVGVAP